MKRLTTRGIRTAEAIRDRESFTTSGSLYGQAQPDGGMSPYAFRGWLSDDERAVWERDSYDVDYVVVSYATPIAWHKTDGTWHIVTQKFSPTTTKHQGNLYLAKNSEPVECTCRNLGRLAEHDATCPVPAS
jgi:hypothetical protein